MNCNARSLNLIGNKFVIYMLSNYKTKRHLYSRVLAEWDKGVHHCWFFNPRSWQKRQSRWRRSDFRCWRNPLSPNQCIIEQIWSGSGGVILLREVILDLRRLMCLPKQQPRGFLQHYSTATSSIKPSIMGWFQHPPYCGERRKSTEMLYVGFLRHLKT